MRDDPNHRRQWNRLPSWSGLNGKLTAAGDAWGMLVLVGLFIVQISIGAVVLRNARQAAELEIKTDLAASANEIAVNFAHLADSYRRVAEAVRDMVGVPPPTPGTRVYLENRIRAIVAEKRNGVVAIAYIGPTPARDWELHPELGALAPRQREAWRDGPPAGGPGQYGLPVAATNGPGWSFPYVVSIPPGQGGGAIVVTVDGLVLGQQLRLIKARPARRIGIWRDDGRFLTGTNSEAARHAIASGLISPLRPGPGGQLQARLPDPLGQGERFVALNTIAGQGLYVTVSSDVELELADYHRFRVIVLLLLAATLVMTAVAGVAVLSHRARRRAEQAAERAQSQQALLTSVLDGVNAGVYRIKVGPGDRFNRYYFNLGTARLLRRTVAEVAAMGPLMGYAEPVPSAEEQRGIVRELHETGTSQCEVQVRCGDGQLRWMRFQLRAISRNGDELDCVCLMTDIEVEKAAAVAAVSTARLAMLGELSTVIAHEIKQPLAVIGVISGTVQMMLQSERPVSRDDMVAKLQRIAGLTQRAAALSDNLRRFARRDDPPLSAIDLGASLEEALLLCGAAMRDSQVKLEIGLPADLPAVLGSPEMIEHVITNLLMNSRHALLHTPAAERRIDITATADAARVVLRVRDTGPGIPAEVLPRLFEAFFTTKPAGEGTGLGLSICANILAAAGGEIFAGNAAEGGAEFTIVLQRADQAASTVDA